MPAQFPAEPSFRWSCYSILDRGTVPSPVEDASEAAWREFDACWEALDRQVRASPGGVAPRMAPPRGVRGPATRPPQARPGVAV
ncbi:MAG TPA: hypothetical protein VGF26_07300 [Ramlibacter sp.]